MEDWARMTNWEEYSRNTRVKDKWGKIWGWLKLPYYFIHPKMTCFPMYVVYKLSLSAPMTKQEKKEILDKLHTRIHYIAIGILNETIEKKEKNDERFC